METEVKIPISQDGLAFVRARLKDLGARRVADRQLETNQLFDFPDHRLKSSGCALRLRIYSDLATLTFKGKISEGVTAKSREEWETVVGDGKILRKILEAAGMQMHFDYSKHREIYQLQVEAHAVEVCLDETPVGIFAEIEAPEEIIKKTADLFGWSPSLFLHKTYPELYAEGDS